MQIGLKGKVKEIFLCSLIFAAHIFHRGFSTSQEYSRYTLFHSESVVCRKIKPKAAPNCRTPGLSLLTLAYLLDYVRTYILWWDVLHRLRLSRKNSFYRPWIFLVEIPTLRTIIYLKVQVSECIRINPAAVCILYSK